MLTIYSLSARKINICCSLVYIASSRTSIATWRDTASKTKTKIDNEPNTQMVKPFRVGAQLKRRKRVWGKVSVDNVLLCIAADMSSNLKTQINQDLAEYTLNSSVLFER